jgi:hypothetical protein
MKRPRNDFQTSLGITHSHSIRCGLSQTALPFLPMDFRRKHLPHDPPNWIDPTQEAFFVTINCLPRGTNQLAHGNVWTELIETLEFREERGEWNWRLYWPCQTTCMAL